MDKSVIIVAGGSGTRMQSAIPKQFIELCGKPILMHTIEKFFWYDNSMDIVLVLPSSQIDFWKELCIEHFFVLKHTIVEGGKTRFHSVKNGLAVIPDGKIVGIHDGVRPLVSNETIARCFETAQKQGNAIPMIPVHESVRKVNDTQNEIIDRSNLRLIQTPQVFHSKLIKNAFLQPFNTSFTDDASVLEQTGTTIVLVDGNRENIKVTEKFDLVVAEAVLKQNNNLS